MFVLTNRVAGGGDLNVVIGWHLIASGSGTSPPRSSATINNHTAGLEVSGVVNYARSKC